MPEYKWQIFFVTGIANITVTIAISGVALALPIIAGEFGVSISTISWLSLVYSMIPSCTLLIFGRIADLFGYRRQFINGFIIFGLSSLLLPSLAKGLAGLIFFRCIQGIGYAMMMSITQALCNKVFPSNERGKALGVNSAFVSIGLAIGPSISGLLMSNFSWRSIFYFNALISLFGVIISMIILEKDRIIPDTSHDMDWLGAVLFAVSIGLFALSLNFSAEWGILSIKFLACITISLCLLLIFIYRENHTNVPLMKVKLFRNSVFTLANGACFCSYTLQQMTTFLIPFFLMNVFLMSKSDSGLIMLVNPATMMLLSPFGGRWADHRGSQKPALTGLCILAAGCAFMSAMTGETTVFIIIIALVLYGAGCGLSVSAINSTIFSVVQREDSGMASGMVGTMRNLGQAIGVVSSSLIISVRQQYYSTRAVEGSIGFPDGKEIYLMAQRDAYYFGFIIIAIAILCMIIIAIKRTGGMRDLGG